MNVRQFFRDSILALGVFSASLTVLVGSIL